MYHIHLHYCCAAVPASLGIFLLLLLYKYLCFSTSVFSPSSLFLQGAFNWKILHVGEDSQGRREGARKHAHWLDEKHPIQPYLSTWGQGVVAAWQREWLEISVRWNCNDSVWGSGDVECNSSDNCLDIHEYDARATLQYWECYSPDSFNFQIGHYVSISMFLPIRLSETFLTFSILSLTFHKLLFKSALQYKEVKSDRTFRKISRK